MKVRLNKTIGIVILVIGLLNASLLLIVNFSTGDLDTTNFLIAIFSILLAIGYLRGSYFEVTDHLLILLNLLGNKSQELSFTDKSAFEVKGKNVILISEDNKKLKLYAFTANQTDWAAFLEWIKQ